MKNGEKKDRVVNDGILFCSGMIAGEGLVGILLAILTVFGLDKVLDLSAKLNLPAGVTNAGSIVVLALVVLSLLGSTLWKKQK
jgi:hypothetical protein